MENARTWAKIAKGQIEGESDTTNFDKSKNESKTRDSDERYDSNEPNLLKAK